MPKKIEKKVETYLLFYPTIHEPSVFSLAESSFYDIMI